ncbi:MAG: DUF4411 family protein [Acidobacteriota bacterium]
MPNYWIDAGVLIHASRGVLRLDMVPQFWMFIEEHLATSRIQMPRLAYDEITKVGFKDELAAWCKARKTTGLCKNESREVQEIYGAIAAYSQENYKPQQARLFLSGADGWLIAHGIADGGIVVTQENEKSNKSKIKIPTIARAFDIRCIDTATMLAELRFSVKNYAK